MAFFGMDNLKTSPAAKALLDSHIPSRIAQQDASVYDFSPQAMECASSRLGWTNLATKPPTDPAEIMVMAQQEDSSTQKSRSETESILFSVAPSKPSSRAVISRSVA